MASKRIVVAGGSGFLGSRICKSAVARGWDVVSISRHGEPAWDTVSSSAQAPGWASRVKWEKADILNPSSYAAYLKGASAVVHSMGILLEADYKHLLQGRGSLATGLQRLFGCGTPAANQPSSTLGEGGRIDTRGRLTYGVMNRDSAVMLARKASEEKVPTFVYISAAVGTPIIPNGYIQSKREAESIISSELPDLRSIFIRPTFMYDSSRKPTLPIALGGIIGSEVNALIGGRLSFLGMMVEKPLKADVVGEAVVESIYNDETKGVVGPKRIEELATKSWRRSML
ncbi:hypothetical protein VTO42DRAFT_423 [Malbranchea cinnamomea]